MFLVDMKFSSLEVQGKQMRELEHRHVVRTHVHVLNGLGQWDQYGRKTRATQVSCLYYVGRNLCDSDCVTYTRANHLCSDTLAYMAANSCPYTLERRL